VKTGPVVVGDTGGADDDRCEAEQKSDEAGSGEQSMLPERHERVPLSQRQFHRVAAARPVGSLLLRPSRLLFGRRRRRDLKRKGWMTTGVDGRIVQGQRSIGLALLDLQRRVDESIRSNTLAYLLTLVATFTDHAFFWFKTRTARGKA